MGLLGRAHQLEAPMSVSFAHLPATRIRPSGRSVADEWYNRSILEEGKLVNHRFAGAPVGLYRTGA